MLPFYCLLPFQSIVPLSFICSYFDMWQVFFINQYNFFTNTFYYWNVHIIEKENNYSKNWNSWCTKNIWIWHSIWSIWNSKTKQFKCQRLFFNFMYFAYLKVKSNLLMDKINVSTKWGTKQVVSSTINDLFMQLVKQQNSLHPIGNV